MFYSLLTIFQCDVVAFILSRRALLLQHQVSVTPMQIASLTLTNTMSLLGSSRLWRQNVNTTSHVRLASDQFTILRLLQNHRQISSPQYLNLIVIKNIATYWFLLFFIWAKLTANHQPFTNLPVCKEAELITTVYNPITGSHSGSFFYLPWKVKLTFFSSL